MKVNHAWFRGGWFDPLTMAWKDIAAGACYDRPPLTEGGPSPGATLFVPFTLGAGRSPRPSSLRLAWYVGQTNLRIGKDPHGQAGAGSRRARTARGMRAGSRTSTRSPPTGATTTTSFAGRRSGSATASTTRTLPPEVIEAVAANLTILKSPTVLRQADGRLWAWEGCGDNAGCCHGSCTHVWNYAQAIPHLFPALERTLRETEFGPSQDDRGHQKFRSALPIRPVAHDFHAAADGQLGGIMKVYRDWRISGDTDWLRRLWPKVKASLDYCIETWDPGHKGWLEEPHHNTYDIEFWGPDGMCTSFYLGALQAAVLDGPGARRRRRRCTPSCSTRACAAWSSELFDGEYFIQKIEWKNLRAKNPLEVKSMVGGYSPEARALLEKEGPKYQYGTRLPGRRRARRVDGAGLRRGPGARPRRRSPATSRPSTSTTSSATCRPTPTRSGPATPAATKAACCSAPGPRAASSRCRSSTPTRSGPASNTRWPRT